ncbi:MAG: hypothetical protein ACTSSB_12135 [Candidatus Heimdallarchaeota archaeon]
MPFLKQKDNYLYMDFYTGGTDSIVDVCAYYINAVIEIPVPYITGFSTITIITTVFIVFIISIQFRKKR